MDIVLSRRGCVPLREQLRFQLEMKILMGDLQPGQRMPSVRALSRRLGLHRNTVSAAYHDLQATGQVRLEKGRGILVRPSPPSGSPPEETVDRILRPALQQAVARGHSTEEIRGAVERWLTSSPDRLVVVDPCREMAEVLAEEIRCALGVPVSSASLAELERDPAPVASALVLTLPYHVDAVACFSPAAVETLTVAVPEDDRAAVLALPAGSRLLLVFHAATVLRFAEAFVTGLRGEKVRVDTVPFSATGDWHRLVPLADLILADAISAGPVRRLAPSRVREVRLLAPACPEHLRPLVRVLLLLADPPVD